MNYKYNNFETLYRGIALLFFALRKNVSEKKAAPSFERTAMCIKRNTPVRLNKSADLKRIGSGSQIRTVDLRIMIPTL